MAAEGRYDIENTGFAREQDHATGNLLADEIAPLPAAPTGLVYDQCPWHHVPDARRMIGGGFMYAQRSCSAKKYLLASDIVPGVPMT